MRIALLLALLIAPAAHAGGHGPSYGPSASSGSAGGISTGAVTTAALTGNGNASSPLGVNSSSVPVFQSGAYPAANGAAITAVTAANISAGTAGISISGNAATVTTNANLTGSDVTSVGNAATLNVGTAHTWTGAIGLTNVALTATGANGNIVSASSITTAGGVFANTGKFSNGVTISSGGLNFNVVGTATQAAVGGGIYYFPYTAAVATTTSGSATILFSTAVIPGGMFNVPGQQLVIKCNYTHSGSGNTISIRVRNTTSGITEVATNTNQTTASAKIRATVYLTWVSHGLWINTSSVENGTALVNDAGFAPTTTQTFDESVPQTYNCGCSGAVANGDCSFLDMRLEWRGMSQ